MFLSGYDKQQAQTSKERSVQVAGCRRCSVGGVGPISRKARSSHKNTDDPTGGLCYFWESSDGGERGGQGEMKKLFWANEVVKTRLLASVVAVEYVYMPMRPPVKWPLGVWWTRN